MEHNSKVEFFPETNLSLVNGLQNERDSVQLPALDTFSENYWMPLYFFVVGRGYSPEDAKDLVQGFFEKIIRENTLRQFDLKKGRLRSFLLMLLKRHLVDSYRKRQARDERMTHVDIDLEEPDNEELGGTAEKTYDVRWAYEIATRVIQRIEEQHAARGKARRFVELKPYLLTRPAHGEIGKIASRLGESQSVVSGQLHRERQRFKLEFESIVRDTTGSVESSAEETRYLFSLLGIVF